MFDKTNFATNKFNRPKELTELVKDVTRWRYGIKAHLESSLESLNLWAEDNPPQLKEIEEIKEEIPEAGVSGGGHLVVGSMKFIPGEDIAVREVLERKMAETPIKVK